MTSLGVCALLVNSISPLSTAPERSQEIRKRSQSTRPASYSYSEVIQRYLLGYHAKTKRSLAEEAECGDEISLSSWIRDGCDPNEVDAYGYTPLLNAATLGRLNAVVELIKNGADVNKAGPFGFTPMHAAAQTGHREVVSVLLASGASINAQNLDMDTPMHLALKCHHFEILFMLVRNGGNVFLKGFQNKDCVQCAKQMGLIELSNRLKNYNVSIGHHAFSSPEFR